MTAEEPAGDDTAAGDAVDADSSAAGITTADTDGNAVSPTADRNTASDAITPSPRVAGLLAELTPAEKCSLVHGHVDPAGNATGYLCGVPRLGIPELRLSDGPLGVRTPRPATAFPASIALASTFAPELACSQGAAMAREAAARDQDVLLAPGLNLIRVPHCGRNFEYYSEDPVLTGRFAAAAIEGIQSEGVIATAKHYVANSQETRRAAVSAAVDDRVLRELYLRGFHDAVDAGVGALMTAYNRVNGTFMSEHADLVRGVLKAEWGFEGVVMSDWFGTESAVRAANGGLDLEMPGTSLEAQFESMGVDPDTVADEMDPAIAEGMPDVDSGGLFAADLVDAVAEGAVGSDRLDDMVGRLLGQLERVGLLTDEIDDTAPGPEAGVDTEPADIPDHRALAERIATRGTVLLKNAGVLPLAETTDIAVIGPNIDEAMLGGGGSSETTPFDQTSPVAGLTRRAEGSVRVARGVSRIEDVSLFDGLVDADADESAESDNDTSSAAATCVDVDDEPSLAEATAAARGASVAAVFVRDAATEAADRDTLSLPGGQNELVERVADAADQTVVVVNASGPVELPWRASVDAICMQWYPGQAHGDAIASVLYGDCDPGGRLPVTLAAAGAYPTADERRFPGVDGVAHYDEGLLMGYRYFDVTDTEPTYPFGHGESYAEFSYHDLAVDGRTRSTVDADGDPSDADGNRCDAAAVLDGSLSVSVTLENTSSRDGVEVVQAYVSSPETIIEDDSLTRPPNELAGFRAVELPAETTRTVEVTLDGRSVGRYDVADGWRVDPGRYRIHVGRSSRHFELETPLTVE